MLVADDTEKEKKVAAVSASFNESSICFNQIVVAHTEKAVLMRDMFCS